MSFVLLGILNAQAAGGALFRYWIGVYGDSGRQKGRGVVVDSSDNILAVGYGEPSGGSTDDLSLIKLDTNGQLVYAKELADSTQNRAGGAAIDDSDNLFLAAYVQDPSKSYEWLLVKYNSAGTVQWQRSLGNNTANVSYGVSTSPTGGDAYLLGRENTGKFVTIKYNASGTIQWQREFDNNTYGLDPRGITTASNGDVYCVGATTINQSSTGGDSFIAKYNSSGTVQWQKVLKTNGQDIFESVITDSNNEPVAVGWQSGEGAGSDDAFIAKYNTSGTLQWQRRIGGSSSDKFIAVTADSSNNYYAVGTSLSTTVDARDILIVKYNSSGTIQWQRKLGLSEYLDDFPKVSIDSLGDLVILFESQELGFGGQDYFVAKLPSDGSLTGTYTLDGVDFYYSSSSLTSATSSLTAENGSETHSTPSYTSNNISLTASTPTYSEELVGIPE